jgi:hypothetical protein
MRLRADRHKQSQEGLCMAALEGGCIALNSPLRMTEAFGVEDIITMSKNFCSKPK